MAEVDLFEKIDSLFTKKEVAGDPIHPFVLHRFLASDMDFARAAAYFQEATWDPEMTWALWLFVLPRLPSAPRMRYVAAKKPEAASKLIARMLEAHPLLSRDDAEFIHTFCERQGRLGALLLHYGFEEEA